MKPKRECGSCVNWVKLSQMSNGRGVCQLFDCAGKAQHGKQCPKWKGNKYHRNDYKRQLNLFYTNK